LNDAAGAPAQAAIEHSARSPLVRKLVYVGIVLLLTSCVPIGVRVQNMLAMWTG